MPFHWPMRGRRNGFFCALFASSRQRRPPALKTIITRSDPYDLQSNPQQQGPPEYGQTTIPFPIPNNEYDHTIELLEGLAIGSPTGQDCQVDSLDSKYPILNRLVTQNINVDELDYLAKRLESFCIGEEAEFQAMAFKFCLSDIKDFINLTFCCQQATVITSFYDMKLGPVYDGRHFPEYFYEPCVASVTLSRWDRSRHETLYLPCSDLKITRTLQRLGVNDTTQYTAVMEDGNCCPPRDRRSEG